MIVFVHCGDAPVPSHLGDTLAITSRVAPRSEIIVLANESQSDRLHQLGNFFSFVPIESFPASSVSNQFREQSALNRDFRNGFWYFATERFLVLADFIRHRDAEDVVHLENDVALYFDPADKVAAFRAFADFAVPLDRNRAIAGLVWIANSRASDRLAQHLVMQLNINDMESVGNFCVGNPDIAKPLPTLPLNYAIEKGLDPARYCQGIDLFGGLFDAAAIGQYIGGVHWLNTPHDSRFFVNESSDLDLRDFDISWSVIQGVRFPVIAKGGVRSPVLSVHAHSKDMLGISPFNHGVPSNEVDVISGERLQAIADLTISTAAITQFHGAENIRSKRKIEIPQNEVGQLLVPDQAFIDACESARTIFIYTHLMLYFKRYVAPRLSKPYVLIAHNSDHSVGLDDLDLLNQPKLTHCWAQNCEVAHTKLSPLPIGLANRQWGATKIAQLVEAARHIEKHKLVYANVAPTHPSRVHALEMARKLPAATIESGVTFEQFIAGLAQHKFCLCPRGNGIDTHRFWEALYLDCIPVIVKADWNSAFSEFPVLLLNSWDEMLNVDLQREFICIKNTAFRFERLSLKTLADRIASSVR
ncbi:MAG: exostosin family protein [Betaproteobacteria bacterium]|nr:exostosin family protein [Betaproteobacteria bacterium]